MLLFYVFFLYKRNRHSYKFFEKKVMFFLTFQDVFWEIRPAVMLNFNQIE